MLHDTAQSKAAASLLDIPLSKIIPTPDNNRRKIDTKDPKFVDLVANVRAVGILCPVLCRPHPTKAGHYDLRAGERRYRAATAAGLATIPAMVREMDDELALDITVIENFQREDLTPMEEARGIASLMRGGRGIDEIASRLGKSRSWVTRRSTLTRLIPAWTAAADKWAIGSAHLELIARYDTTTQERLAKEFDIKNGNYQFTRHFVGADSLDHLRRSLAEDMHELRLAPWKLDDLTLCPVAGACATCPKRSSVQPDLFEATEAAPHHGAKPKTGDRCLDPECWKAKQTEHTTRALAAVREKHPTAPLISQDYYTTDKTLISRSHYDSASKKDKNAVLAVIADGDQAGTTKWIKLSGQLQKRVKAQVAKTNGQKGPATSLEDRRKALERRRWALVITDLLKSLHEYDEMPAEGSAVIRTRIGILYLAAAFGMSSHAQGDSEIQKLRHQKGSKTDLQILDWFLGRQTSAPDIAALEVWRRIMPKLSEALRYFSPSDIDEHKIELARRVAVWVGLDPNQMKGAADLTIPEPKSWAGEKAPTGKPTKATKKKAKAKQ